MCTALLITLIAPTVTAVCRGGGSLAPAAILGAIGDFLGGRDGLAIHLLALAAALTVRSGRCARLGCPTTVLTLARKGMP